MSACSDSQSTILPFPSSPHWEPTTTTLAMRRLSSASPMPGIASKQQRLVRHSNLYGIRDRTRTGKAAQPGRIAPSAANHLILRVLFTPCRRAPLTTPDDSALSKAISRQDRGGRTRPAASGGDTPRGRQRERLRFLPRGKRDVEESGECVSYFT